MQDRLTKFRSALLSTGLAGLIHLPVLGFDGVLRSLAEKWHKPPLLLVAITLVISSFIAFSILQSKIGVQLYESWIQLCRAHAYNQADQKQFEKTVTACIKRSPFMFSVLASGQTIQTGPEQFIATVLEALPKVDGVLSKNIRLLLLRRGSEPWKDRVLHLQQLSGSFKPEDYKRFSERTEALFRRVNGWVEFYNHAPTWRMLIFEDRAFVSHYYEPLHREIVSVFYRDRPGPYRWFYSEFLALCPRYWTDEEAAIEYATKSSLEHRHNDVACKAKELYDARVRRGEAGSSAEDWANASHELREILKKDLIHNLLPPSPPPLPEQPHRIH